MRMQHDIATPYLVFLADARDALAAKTGYGLARWCPGQVVGQLRFPDCNADLGVPDLDLEAAVDAGARTLAIGTVSPGGALPANWRATLLAALDAGLDIASGMHERLADNPELAAKAAACGRRLHDVRHHDAPLPVGRGEPRSGRRLLTMGTDCSVGKKYAALAIAAELSARGVPTDFRATGQTGILIAGGGIAVDAVVADFIAGAAEVLSPPAADDHWDIIEGQGSLLHPSFAGVTAGLLHGSQPDAFVVCHEPTRTTMRNVGTPIARIDDIIELTLRLGRLTNPDIHCAGLCINTSALDDPAPVLQQYAERYRLPACDPLRTGVGPIVDRLLQ